MINKFLKPAAWLAVTVLLSPGMAAQQSSKATGSLGSDREQLLKYCGEYLPAPTDHKMTTMQVLLYDGVLYRHVNNDYVQLNPVSEHKFVYDDDSGRSLEFELGKDGKVKEVLVTRPDGTFTLGKNAAAAPETRTTATQSKPEQITRLLSKYAEYGQFNGSALVAENGKVIYKKGIGMANMEWEIPNRPDTKHRLGSITKQFTAMLILQLAEQGKLKLEAKVADYLPDYPEKPGSIITLHHLLTHSSGIPNYTSLPDYRKRMSSHYTPEELVNIFSGLPLEFKPGEKFAYSNSGYSLLGLIIEKVTGQTYEQCLQNSIFTPLKMTGTGFDHPERIIKNRAAGYDGNGVTYMNATYIDMSMPFAAGSMYSTVEDLYLWDQALYTDALLSKKWRDLMFTPHMQSWGGYYGYGWSLHTVVSKQANQNLQVIEHGGGINGFNTIISRIPADKNLVVLLNNTGSAPLDEINYAIRAILYNRPYDMPKQSLAHMLAAVIKTEGLAAGMARLKGFRSSGLYAIKESEINEVGYEFLQAGKVQEAIEFFKLNVEVFPHSGNCYDSLGEAYLKNGNKQLAIENYKKSIALDPTNENGKKVLAEISK